ncbi:MAG: hypothetical protein DCC58_08345 [Chloroflexi bacterium]|nr:MAG: hypothetical protein DCC58_08345 [Chloroflexota bacterium]
MRRAFGLLVLAAGLALGIAPASVDAGQHSVYVIQIDNEIDLGLAAYLNRVLAEAADADAAAVVLEINTPGGRLDAALEMRDALLGASVRTLAFVNREAFSAGALIAIACDEIYMTPGAVLGAATPVLGSGETADEKIVSAVRKTFKSTAEARGREPAVAEAMVDPDVAIDGLIEQGKLLTLTTTEAVEWGYADGVVVDRATLLDQAGLGAAAVVETEIRLAERLVRFLTNPLVASLLVSIGSLLILIDLFTAGFGVMGVVGIGMFAAFFWGHFLAGLAGWEGVALVVLGIALLGVEAFIVPGFGVAGILGIIALLAGVFLSLIGDEIVTDEALMRAGLTVAAVFVFLLLGVIALLLLLPSSSRWSRLVLSAQVGVPDAPQEPRKRRRLRAARPEEYLAGPARPPAAEPQTSLLHARGVALSDLRPSGFALIRGARVDVVSDGDFIPAGSEIEVYLDEGYRRVVRLVDPSR